MGRKGDSVGVRGIKLQEGWREMAMKGIKLQDAWGETAILAEEEWSG